MSDHLTTGTEHDAAASELEVLRWRRHGDVWEALVGREHDGSLVTEWVPALPMTREHTAGSVGSVDGSGSEETADAVAAQVRREVARAFGRHGQYHEMVEIEDLERFALLERIAAEIEQAEGTRLGKAAVRHQDGLVRVCLWLAEVEEDDQASTA